MSDIWLNHIENPSLMIDAGPGVVGSEAWMFADKFPGVPILGYEPSPQRVKTIKEDFPGTLHQKGLGSSSGTITVFDQAQPGTQDNMVLSYGTGDNPIEVEIETVDNIGKHHGSGIVLFADCEGFELEILKGAESLLRNKKLEGIVLELWQESPYENLKGQWATEREIVEYLEQFGYKKVLTWAQSATYNAQTEPGGPRTDTRFSKHDGLFKHV